MCRFIHESRGFTGSNLFPFTIPATISFFFLFCITTLKRHLQSKTAWSDQSLIGCRVSCLIDHREWHEGIVTQHRKSGKHHVEFRTMYENKWMQMSKAAFYIVERPTCAADPHEFKEDHLIKPEVKI